MSTCPYAYSHDSKQTRWYDLFELNTSDGHGWMLLDLPGAPCDVTQLDMRTMSQRLRKAQECAAAGGKYGMVQAVLLSLDSQPGTYAQWLREAIALEACSRVLLPEAHEVPVNLDAARAAYQRLTPAEQQLWRQLQAARTTPFHESSMEPDVTEGYIPNECFIANVFGGVTGDVTLLGHGVVRVLLQMCRWDVGVSISKRYALVGNPATPASMQAAYNWALACCHHHGRDHPDTRAALVATEKADPQAWVPNLLAGLAYPVLSLASRHVRGHKMEAAEYCHHYGAQWLVSGANLADRRADFSRSEFSAFSAPLTWLLTSRSIPVPTPQEQRDVAALRLLVCGDPANAYCSVAKLCAEARTLLVDASWPGSREQLEQWGIPRLLRVLAVSAASLAVLTMNLPPVTAAPELWKGVGVQMGGKQLPEVAVTLQEAAEFLVPWMYRLVHAYYGNGAPTPASAVAASRLGFWNPQELFHMLQVAPFLSVAAARWMWQCGDAAAAHHACRLEAGGGGLYLMQQGVAVDAAMGHPLSNMGLFPSSTAPIDSLVRFLLQQKARQGPGQGLQQLLAACQSRQQQGPEVAAAAIAQLGDPQEQRLYSLFPGWLDQLVSQVTGRQVTLVVEPAAAHRVDHTVDTSCRVYLKDAASGERTPFHWRKLGDACGDMVHLMLVQQAVMKGCSDRDLQLFCPGVEPYTAGTAAGSGSRPSSSSGSQSSRPRQQQRQTTAGPAEVGAGRTARNMVEAVASLSLAGRLAEAAPVQQSHAGAQQPATAAVAGPVARGNASSSSRPAASGGTAAGAGSSSSHGGGSRVKASRPCAQCGELFPRLKQCVRCKAVSYCSRDCQKAHWKAGHNEACQERPAQ